jgi:hypothetical protein
MPTTLRDLEGTRWTGRAELWLDPAGNDAIPSDCALEVGRDASSRGGSST